MRRLLRAAAALTLVGLALMVWSLFQPTPLPVMLAMSLGQLIGTSAFAMFGLAVLLDLRRSRRIHRESQGLGLSELRELLSPPGREALDSPSLDGIPIHKPEPEPEPKPNPAPAPAPERKEEPSP